MTENKKEKFKVPPGHEALYKGNWYRAGEELPEGAKPDKLVEPRKPKVKKANNTAPEAKTKTNGGK